MFILGVGIVLITVSGIAWRLTSQDAPSCRAMLGLGVDRDNPNLTGEGDHPRRFVARPPPAFGRPHHPYAGKLDANQKQIVFSTKFHSCNSKILFSISYGSNFKD